MLDDEGLKEGMENLQIDDLADESKRASVLMNVMVALDINITKIIYNVGKRKICKNMYFYSKIPCVSHFLIFFAPKIYFFRDSAFLHSVISFGTGAVNRKLQNQEKQNREKINFLRPKN